MFIANVFKARHSPRLYRGSTERHASLDIYDFSELCFF
jgi:hypothetical protein